MFAITKTASGYANTPTTLFSFSLPYGYDPLSGLLADGNGNLFGTTGYGGTADDGTVFEIANTAPGYSSTPTTIVNFNYGNGATPYAGLIADANGDLFGSTESGGRFTDGPCSKLPSPPAAIRALPQLLLASI